MVVSSFIYSYRSNLAFQQQFSLLTLEGGLVARSFRKCLSCFFFGFLILEVEINLSQNSFCDIKFFHFLVQGELIKLV